MPSKVFNKALADVTDFVLVFHCLTNFTKKCAIFFTIAFLESFYVNVFFIFRMLSSDEENDFFEIYNDMI